MRHRVAERKLGMKSAHRQAMLANMATSLILNDKIETTLTRAKEVRCIADRIVTLSKRGTVHAARQARRILRNRSAVQKAFAEFAKRFEGRNGGYTRILKLGYRHGDSAPMAIIEYVASPHKIERAATGKEGKAKKAKKEEKTEALEKVKTSLKEKVLGKAKVKADAKHEAKEDTQENAKPKAAKKTTKKSSKKEE